MLGQMMVQPLLISALIEHAERYHADTEIVSVETTGGLARTTWGGIARNARKLASALQDLGLGASDRVATIAWNNHRHLEIYFGVSGSELVLHTINPRLSPEQLVFVLNHAEDRVLFVDRTFLPIAVKLRAHLPKVEHVVLMGPRDDSLLEQLPELKFYDELVESGRADYAWPSFDENTASSLCYTSGTTGNPKGVLYSHRSTVLHSFAVSLPDGLGIGARESLLPVVPMFHVNAWGVPYAAAMTGARLVLPGPGLDGESLVKLIDGERVTMALGVPTIWHNLLKEAARLGSELKTLTHTVVGGSACPPSMITEFRVRYGVDTIHAWGMTELSPVGTVNKLLAKHTLLSDEEQATVRLNQGRPPFGIELELVGEEGHVLPSDGKTPGRLLARGHWVVADYFRAEPGTTLEDGWFDTGDISTLDPDGFMTITDRSKDVIKSGGEWISSVELENIAVGHPLLADAAVIGVAEKKWGERPLLVAVKADGMEPSQDELLAFYEGKVPKWHTPDAVVFTEALPRNATGKVLKNQLRERYQDALMR